VQPLAREASYVPETKKVDELLHISHHLRAVALQSAVGGMALSGLQEKIEKGIPLGKMGRAQDIANAMMFLLSPAASQITGANLVVDGGMTTTLMQAAFR